ncbi:hypothetical protein CCY99_07540 [Helicobacter sp. 16-1353]|uniref:hypothetical protein n=1 Tax=Helicobacter sp. 16-1353 TaxID=2004996 RepID=UPI000DCD41D7|nr:hypothetical protein [Helicobacter sp. 16-1353]RAX52236.1 hypothetical protein CCY99_07540 [Helicobacter sp. 16-1353]
MGEIRLSKYIQSKAVIAHENTIDIDGKALFKHIVHNIEPKDFNGQVLIIDNMPNNNSDMPAKINIIFRGEETNKFIFDEIRFENATNEDVSISFIYCIIKQKIECIGKTIAYSISFSNVEFQGWISWKGSTFYSLEFLQSTFNDVSIYNSTFNKEVKFSNSKFNEIVTICMNEFNEVFNISSEKSETYFNDYAHIEFNQFNAEVRMNNIVFNGIATIEHNTFNDKATFNDTMFGKATCCAQHNTFSAEVQFIGTIFKGDTSFNNSTFHKKNNF